MIQVLWEGKIEYLRSFWGDENAELSGSNVTPYDSLSPSEMKFA